MLTESERVAQRVKQVRVKEMEWIGKRLMIVPPKNPRDEIRIARVDDGVAQARHVRPGQDGGEKTEGKKDQELANQVVTFQTPEQESLAIATTEAKPSLPNQTLIRRSRMFIDADRRSKTDKSSESEMFSSIRPECEHLCPLAINISSLRYSKHEKLRPGCSRFRAQSPHPQSQAAPQRRTAVCV